MIGCIISNFGARNVAIKTVAIKTVIDCISQLAFKIPLKEKRKRIRVDSISEHFRAAGFKLRKTNKHEETLRKQQEANEQCAHMLRTLLEKLEKGGFRSKGTTRFKVDFFGPTIVLNRSKPPEK